MKIFSGKQNLNINNKFRKKIQNLKKIVQILICEYQIFMCKLRKSLYEYECSIRAFIQTNTNVNKISGTALAKTDY